VDLKELLPRLILADVLNLRVGVVLHVQPSGVIVVNILNSYTAGNSFSSTVHEQQVV
jgi:hypothetical protein